MVARLLDSARELNDEEDTESPEESADLAGECRLAVWRCLSGVLEQGVRQVETKGHLYRCRDVIKGCHFLCHLVLICQWSTQE